MQSENAKSMDAVTVNVMANKTMQEASGAAANAVRSPLGW